MGVSPARISAELQHTRNSNSPPLPRYTRRRSRFHFGDQQPSLPAEGDRKIDRVDLSSDLAILRVVGSFRNQLCVGRWRHGREQGSDGSNAWLAAFEASAAIKSAELVLAGPQRAFTRPIATRVTTAGVWRRIARTVALAVTNAPV